MKNTVYAILIPFLSLATVQICLRYPMTRELFTDIEYIEGIRAEKQEKDASVEVEMIYGIPSEKIEILFNSECVSYFDTGRVSFSVPCEGVIQIKNFSGSDIRVKVNYNPEKIKISNTKKHIGQGIYNLCIVSEPISEVK